jgi:hypothetical protein
MAMSEKQQLLQLNAMVLNGESLSLDQSSLHEFLKKKELQENRLMALEEEADLRKFICSLIMII